MHYQAKNYGNFVVNLVQYLEKKIIDLEYT